MAHLLWTVIIVLFVLWVLGLALRIGGKLIHIAFLAALALIVFNLLTKG